MNIFGLKFHPPLRVNKNLVQSNVLIIVARLADSTQGNSGFSNHIVAGFLVLIKDADRHIFRP